MRNPKMMQIIAHLSLRTEGQYESWLIDRYKDEKMSSHEIHEYIMVQMPSHFKYNVRSVQRTIKRALLRRGEKMRSIKEAFKIAMQKGRMNHDHQRKVHKIKRNHLKPSKRYEILKRDGFMCVLCGATAHTTVLEIDHKVSYAHGGKHTDENMRTLCWNCNTGKRVVEKER